METLINYMCDHAHAAPWVIFCLFLLSGLNIPISEDVLLLTGGIIASTCIPDETLYLFCWLYAGSLCAAWETYWIGRYFGPKLYDIRWFNRIITPHRIKRVIHYYEKFGILAFMVCRFCPGGVRNVFFSTAGLIQMPFHRFALRDAFAASISVTAIFSLGYYFGANHEIIVHYLKTYSEVAIGIVIAGICLVGYYIWRRSVD